MRKLAKSMARKFKSYYSKRTLSLHPGFCKNSLYVRLLIHIFFFVFFNIFKPASHSVTAWRRPSHSFSLTLLLLLSVILLLVCSFVRCLLFYYYYYYYYSLFLNFIDIDRVWFIFSASICLTVLPIFPRLHTHADTHAQIQQDCGK